MISLHPQNNPRNQALLPSPQFTAEQREAGRLRCKYQCLIQPRPEPAQSTFLPIISVRSASLLVFIPTQFTEGNTPVERKNTDYTTLEAGMGCGIYFHLFTDVRAVHSVTGCPSLEPLALWRGRSLPSTNEIWNRNPAQGTAPWLMNQRMGFKPQFCHSVAEKPQALPMPLWACLPLIPSRRKDGCWWPLRACTSVESQGFHHEARSVWKQRWVCLSVRA